MGLSPPELDCLFLLPPVPSSQYRNPTIRFLLTALSRHIFLKTHTHLYIHTHLLNKPASKTPGWRWPGYKDIGSVPHLRTYKGSLCFTEYSSERHLPISTPKR